MLNYAVPVLTELLFEKIPDKINFKVPVFGEKFKFAEISDNVEYNEQYIHNLTVSSITKNRIISLLGNVKTMKVDKITSDLIIGIIPSAYISGNHELIKKALSTEKFKPLTKETLNALSGAENDDTITNS